MCLFDESMSMQKPPLSCAKVHLVSTVHFKCALEFLAFIVKPVCVVE